MARADNTCGFNSSATGNFTITNNCSITSGVEGIDNGNLIVSAAKTFTIAAGAQLVLSPGKEINFSQDATSQLVVIKPSNQSGAVVKGSLCAQDADGDGYALKVTPWSGQTEPIFTLALGASACPSGYTRKGLLTSLTQLDCFDNDVSKVKQDCVLSAPTYTSGWDDIGTCGQYNSGRQNQQRTWTKTVVTPASDCGGAACGGLTGIDYQDIACIPIVCTSGDCCDIPTGQYKSINTLIGTCLKCTGSSNISVNQTSAEDLGGNCATGAQGSATACQSNNCSGSGDSCGYVSAGATCRASGGSCDIAETCTGSNYPCPSDSFQPDTTICSTCAVDNPAFGACQRKGNGLKCIGSSNSCSVGYGCTENAPVAGNVWNGSAWASASCLLYCSILSSPFCSGASQQDDTGGTITHSGGYTIHTFTTAGSDTYHANSNHNIEVLVVAGGGSGGGSTGGGGGAGGLIHNSSYAVTTGATTVTVGNGGPGGQNQATGINGDNSSFGSSLIALGGGGGGFSIGGYGNGPGLSGGSGGGGQNYYGQTDAGSGTTNQGNAGGTGNSCNAGGGGGGGAGGPGGTGNAIGGVGLQYDISGTLTYYAGGGGGGDYTCNFAGGLGGGGTGRAYAGDAGTPNTGGGGGGGWLYGGGQSGAGGSGIVIVKYLTENNQGNQVQQSAYGCNTGGTCDTGTARATCNGATCTGGENSRCSSGSCANLCSDGIDNDGDGLIDGQDPDCGAVCTAGDCCNLATGQYYAANTPISTCKKCTGSSNTSVNQTSGEDLGGNCATGAQGSATSCQSNNCSGTGDSCGYVAGGTTCRASGGSCDIAETCTGANYPCPSDSFQPDTTICSTCAVGNPASGACQRTGNGLKCIGSSNSCSVGYGCTENAPVAGNVWNGSAWASASCSLYCSSLSSPFCTVQQVQQSAYGCNTSGTCDTGTARATCNGATCTGGENSRCTGGSCTNLCSDGIDNDNNGYTDAQDSACGGGSQCTSGSCCDIPNGRFKTANTSISTCLKCTGSSATPVNQTSGEDLGLNCNTGSLGSATACQSNNCSGSGDSCGYVAGGTLCLTGTFNNPANGSCRRTATDQNCSGSAYNCNGSTVNRYEDGTGGQVWWNSAWPTANATIYCGVSGANSCSGQQPQGDAKGCSSGTNCGYTSSYKVNVGSVCGGGTPYCNNGTCGLCANTSTQTCDGNSDGYYCGMQTCASGSWGSCSGDTGLAWFYRDADSDGYGDPNNAMVNCANLSSFSYGGYTWVNNSYDCNDSDVNITTFNAAHHSPLTCGTGACVADYLKDTCSNGVWTSGTCTPLTPPTCSDLHYTCGTQNDTCGGTINCGTCSLSQTCISGHCTSWSCGMSVLDDESNSYDTVLIGTQCWMKQNLNIGKMITASQAQFSNGVFEKWCQNDDPNYCTTYGGLYTWGEAMKYTSDLRGICPAGWHIPTSNGDWTILTSYVGPNAGRDLKAVGQGNGTDFYGFSGLLGGSCIKGSCSGYGSYLIWWNSDYPPGFCGRNAGAYDTSLNGTCYSDHSVGASVRCIQDGGCQPDCTGKICGDDGCGGFCGTCPAPQTCLSGTSCICQVCEGPPPPDNKCGSEGACDCGVCDKGYYCDNSKGIGNCVIDTGGGVGAVGL